MDNLVFFDEENIPMLHDEEDYDEDRMPDTSRVET